MKIHFLRELYLHEIYGECHRIVEREGFHASDKELLKRASFLNGIAEKRHEADQGRFVAAFQLRAKKWDALNAAGLTEGPRPTVPDSVPFSKSAALDALDSFYEVGSEELIEES